MVFCPICHSSMVHVRRFNPEGEFEFDACRNCFAQTTPKEVKRILPNIYMQDKRARIKEKKRIRNKCIMHT